MSREVSEIIYHLYYYGFIEEVKELRKSGLTIKEALSRVVPKIRKSIKRLKSLEQRAMAFYAEQREVARKGNVPFIRKPDYPII